MNAVAAIFQAIASFFGWKQQRDAEENTAPMVAAQTAQNQQADRDIAQKDVAAAMQNADPKTKAAALAELEKRESE